ncbi:hypothetical protein SGPA1_10673 [Streptomyces misionensis JCM 4497]
MPGGPGSADFANATFARHPAPRQKSGSAREEETASGSGRSMLREAPHPMVKTDKSYMSSTGLLLSAPISGRRARDGCHSGPLLALRRPGPVALHGAPGVRRSRPGYYAHLVALDCSPWERAVEYKANKPWGLGKC